MSMVENDNRLEFQFKAGHDNIRQPFPAYVHIKQKYQEDSRLLAAVFTRKRTFQDSTDEEHKAKVKRFITNKRREQCRNNQARYRDRQRIHMRELQESSITLRQEVQELSQKRYSLCYGADTKNNAWSAVVEYFRLFRHGILISMSPVVPHVKDQEYFLRTVMASDVALGERSGVGTLIGQWRRYSAYFSSPHLQLKRVEEQPMGVLLH